MSKFFFKLIKMKRNSILVVSIVTAAFVTGAVTAVAVQEKTSKVPSVKRVKRPQFTERDWDGIYFENLFKEGLVGDRPERVGPGQTANASPSDNAGESGDENATFAWSKYISASTIEDEVKAIQNQLTIDVTTPVKFKSEYAKSHQSFSVLSMVFGIIREYDDEVRWKKYAPVAQASFERAAANSRVGTIQAYESCKRRNEDLKEMIRGGNFGGTDKPADDLDWSVVVDRNPIMYRLDAARIKLKELTANKGQFNREIGKVLHESQMVAAMAQTLQRENMPEYDEDGYVDYAKQMSAAAGQAVEACKAQDYDAASKAINLIGQNCSNCHDDWK